MEPTARDMAMSSLVWKSLWDVISGATGLKIFEQFMNMRKIILRMSRDPD